MWNLNTNEFEDDAMMDWTDDDYDFNGCRNVDQKSQFDYDFMEYLYEFENCWQKWLQIMIWNF